MENVFESKESQSQKKKIRFTFHLSAQTSSLTDFFGYENNNRVVWASVYQRMNDKWKVTLAEGKVLNASVVIKGPL